MTIVQRAALFARADLAESYLREIEESLALLRGPSRYLDLLLAVVDKARRATSELADELDPDRKIREGRKRRKRNVRRPDL